MRVSDDKSLAEGFFAGDLSDGKTNLECSNCKNISEHKLAIDLNPTICPNCNQEMFYRSWFEW